VPFAFLNNLVLFLDHLLEGRGGSVPIEHVDAKIQSKLAPLAVLTYGI